MPGLSSEPKLGGAPRLGRYELIAGIASGGMGAVMLARLAAAGGFQRLFAIKILHKNYAADSEFLEMLLDEARIAGRIHHPNVVGMHEVSESAEHGYYLVMDYVEGFPLSDVLSRFASAGVPARAWPIVTRVIYDALQGLHAAHSLADDNGESLHVVHRDVSPQNILIGTDGIARVTDFGIAKAAARLVQTRDGQVRGKIAYMSPEHARGKALDNRSDLFAAGIVLWESLTLQRLFKAKNELETYAKLMNAPVRPPSELVPGLPPALDEVCLRALERDPMARFQTAREMAQALERAARAGDVFADSHQVGEWIARTFASQLAERRAAIRVAAAKDTLISAAPEMTPSHGLAAIDEPPTVVQQRSPRAASSAGMSAPMSVPRLPDKGANGVTGWAVRGGGDDDLDQKRTTKYNERDAPPEMRDAIETYRRSLEPAEAPVAAPPATPSFEPVASAVPWPSTANPSYAHGAPMAVNPTPAADAAPQPSSPPVAAPDASATSGASWSMPMPPAQPYGGPGSQPPGLVTGGYGTPAGPASRSAPPPATRSRVGVIVAFVLLAFVALAAVAWIYLVPAYLRAGAGAPQSSRPSSAGAPAR